MFNIDKKNALFIHGVVIANGIPDADNDVLSKEDIKRLNSSYLSHDTDTNHDFLKNNGIEIIENYISKTEETIHDKKVPKGSWLATMMIWDNDLKSQIRQGRLNGFSLASQPNCEIKKEDLFNKRTTYKTYKNVENLTPMFISLVDGAANGYNLEFYSYNAYVTKSKKKEAYNLSDNESNTVVDVTKQFLEYLSNIRQNGDVVANKPESVTVTKAAPPQGGIAPTMQPQQGNAFGQPVSLETINHKLDQLIQVIQGAQQVMKSSSTESVTKSEKDTGEEAKQEKITKSSCKSKTVKKAEEKKNDGTQEPVTSGGGDKDDLEPPVGKDKVEPSSKLDGDTPKKDAKKKAVIKSAAPVTHKDINSTSDAYQENMPKYDFGTNRDALGRPIRK